MEAERYTLQLNRTHLLFIPRLDLAHDPNSSSGAVVQICLRGDHEEGDISNIFAAEQASVTRTIETLLVGHVNALHELPQRVVIEDVVSGYTLIGVRKPWEYGRGRQFCLGDITLQPAEHKWVFRFETAK
ncbi:hypothetical protein J3R83DRAFT_5056 [Lanmaoa asiatica]|nr:hypothetical protein J3R83DRAFT_5056 [Lanmaoa asiatica]